MTTTPKAQDYDGALRLTLGLDPQNVSMDRLADSPDPEATQLRANLDKADRVAMIERMTKDLAEKGATTPPVMLVKISAKPKPYLQLISGFARRDAHRKAGRKTIPAYILPGTYTIPEAVALAAGANNEHGISVTQADKQYALFRVLAASQLTHQEVEGKRQISGILPNGELFSMEKVAALTGTGSASVSKMTVSNLFAQKTAIFKHMITYNDDGTISLADPRDYDPSEAKAAKELKTARRNAATAAATAAKDAARATAAADEMAATKGATDDEVDLASRRATEAAALAATAAAAHKAATAARSAETIKAKAQEAIDAAAKVAALASGQELDTTDAKKNGGTDPADANPTNKAGSRNANFVMYPRDPSATATGIIRAIVEGFDSKKNAAAFLGRLSEALAIVLAPYADEN